MTGKIINFINNKKAHNTAGGEKLIIILTIFIDVLGIGIIIPILPFYVESFGVSAFFVTMLFAVFSFFSFFSAPFLGSLSDKIGRRPVLLVSIFSTAVGWFVFAGASNVIFLFIGRIIDGLAAGNFPIAQSYLVDIAKDDKERTANLGLTGAIFGIGLIIGPMLGGILSSISTSLPFWLAGGLATLNLIGAYFFLPETHKEMNKEKKISFNPFLPIKKVFTDLKLRSRYLAWFLFGIAVSIEQSILALFLYAKFGFTAAMVSYLLTAMGIVIAINQGFLIKRFWLKYFKESFLEVWFFLVFAIAFLVFGFGNLYFLFLGLFVFVISQSVLRVVVTSAVSGIAGSEKRGESLGAMASILSVAMIIGPPIAGLVFKYHISWPIFISAFFMFLAFLVMKFSCVEHENFKEEKEIPQAF